MNILLQGGQSLGGRLDLSTRHEEGQPGISQYLVRGGVSYRLPWGIEAVSGLGRIRYYDPQAEGQVEWRPYQDLAKPWAIGRTSLQQRLRIEPRFFRSLKPSAGHGPGDFLLRLRYRLQWQCPLLALSRVHPERMLMLTVGNEVMAHPVHGPSRSFFGTNRMLLSPTLRWGESLDLAFTYNHQYSKNSHSGEQEAAEILWLNITTRIKTRRQAKKA